MLLEYRRRLIHLAIPVLGLFGTFLVHPITCCAAQITWTNTAGGDWNTAVNWSPNQVPGVEDSASITNAGTYRVTLNRSGAVANLVLGGAGFGTQTFQASSSPLAAGSVSINSGGVLALVTNEVLSGGAVMVASGGVLSCNATLSTAVTVESGGKFLLLGSSIIGEGSTQENTNYWLWVQGGAEVDAVSNATLVLYTPMTNAGLANFTNSGIRIYNNGTSGYRGALWNQPSGALNLFSGAGITGYLGADNMLNEGAINVANGDSTISTTNLTNVGNVTALPGAGTLRFGALNGSLAGTFNAAAGSLIQFVAANNPGVSPAPDLVLGGAGQYQFVSGTLMLPTDVLQGMVMTGGNLVLGPAFQGGTITNLTLEGISLTNYLPIAGALTMTHGTLMTTSTLNNMTVVSLNGVSLYGGINVGAGGLLSCSGSTLVGAQVTVQSGGKLLLLGSTVVNNRFWVQSGGELDASSNAALSVQTMTNAGLANFTNSHLSGAVWNTAGGVLNLISGSAISSGSLFNTGTINITNGNSTINLLSISNQGTVVTMPGTGTLRIGNFNALGSLTGTYNAAAGTFIQFVGGSYPGTSAGTPLVLGGAGQYQFVSGTLTLTTDVIPGLVITGGNLLLGPGFQGGAITNLALNGINLTNNLPIHGTLAMTNAILASTSIMTNTGALSLSSMTMYGKLSTASGGSLSCSGSTLLGAQVTVQNGGKFLLLGPTTIGQAGLNANTNDWLWVQSGGELDAAYNAPLYLYTAMTNGGFANFTNYGISIYSTGSSGYNGRLWNRAGGVLNLISTAGIVGGGFGTDFLVNQGTLNCLSPNATSLINVNSFTNAGSLSALNGTLRLQPAHLVFQPSGTLGVGLSSPTVYGLIDIPGGASLAGAFAAILNDGFVPQVGASFNVVTYGSFTNTFSNPNFQSIAPAPALPGLQHAVSWTTTYSSTFMTITAQQLTEQFVFAGSGGQPGQPYVVLGSTNLALPRVVWTPLVTNYFDASGSFIFATNVDSSTRQQFFTYRYQ